MLRIGAQSVAHALTVQSRSKKNAQVGYALLERLLRVSVKLYGLNNVLIFCQAAGGGFFVEVGQVVARFQHGTHNLIKGDIVAAI